MVYLLFLCFLTISTLTFSHCASYIKGGRIARSIQQSTANVDMLNGQLTPTDDLGKLKSLEKNKYHADVTGSRNDKLKQGDSSDNKEDIQGGLLDADVDVLDGKSTPTDALGRLQSFEKNGGNTMSRTMDREQSQSYSNDNKEQNEGGILDAGVDVLDGQSTPTDALGRLKSFEKNGGNTMSRTMDREQSQSYSNDNKEQNEGGLLDADVDVLYGQSTPTEALGRLKSSEKNGGDTMTRTVDREQRQSDSNDNKEENQGGLLDVDVDVLDGQSTPTDALGRLQSFVKNKGDTMTRAIDDKLKQDDSFGSNRDSYNFLLQHATTGENPSDGSFFEESRTMNDDKQQNLIYKQYAIKRSMSNPSLRYFTMLRRNPISRLALVKMMPLSSFKEVESPFTGYVPQSSVAGSSLYGAYAHAHSSSYPYGYNEMPVGIGEEGIGLGLEG